MRNLLRTVFGKSGERGDCRHRADRGPERIACGPYPATVAKALLESAQQLIRSNGHPLLITASAADAARPCDLCGALEPVTDVFLIRRTVCLCGNCLIAARASSENLPGEEFRYAFMALDWHFADVPRNQIMTRSRQFPGHMRADVQTAIDRLFDCADSFLRPSRATPLRDPRACLADGEQPQRAADRAAAVSRRRRPGARVSRNASSNGLWLCQTEQLRYAVLLSYHRDYQTEPGLRIELAVPAGAAGNALVQRTFAELEAAVTRSTILSRQDPVA